MRKNKVNLRRKESIVNLIASPHLVQKWGSPKKHLVDLIKIVTSKFAFFELFLIIVPCLVILVVNQKSENG